MEGAHLPGAPAQLLMNEELRERVVQLAIARVVDTHPTPLAAADLGELVLGVLRSIEEPFRSKQAQTVLDKVDGGTPVGSAISATCATWLDELQGTIRERFVKFLVFPQPQPCEPAQAQREHGGDDHVEDQESWTSASSGPPEPPEPVQP
eukprot:COSAG04_NODE_11141_length_728_cov_0.853736_1_plen_149_part_10